MQELHEAELAASVAQDQLAHEQQRTGRLKHAIKSAFEEARTPAAGVAGATEGVCLLQHENLACVENTRAQTVALSIAWDGFGTSEFSVLSELA